MWKQIKRNQRSSIFIILLILLLIPLTGYCIGFIIFHFLYIGYKYKLTFIPALSVIITSGLFLYVIFHYRSNPILKIFNIYKITRTNHIILNNIVEEMTIASGLSKIPKVYIIDCPVPNAFASGFKPSQSTIIVTTGLLTELNREELQGVIAHEIAHIVNKDTMYMMFSGFILSTISIIARAMYVHVSVNEERTQKTKKADYMPLHPIVRIIIWFICTIIADTIISCGCLCCSIYKKPARICFSLI